MISLLLKEFFDPFNKIGLFACRRAAVRDKEFLEDGEGKL